MNTIRSIVLALVACAALPAAGTAAGTRAAAGPTLTPVMVGLDNPRGLAVGPEGAIYVAEAGKGGPAPCQLLRQGELPAGTPSCYGPTGRVSRYWKGRQEAVVTGLPSYAIPSGQATGPSDLTVHGHRALITIGWGDNPALRNTPPSAVWQQFGRLVQASLEGRGGWEPGTDIAAFEAAANPDHGDLNSNPYGILGRKQGQVFVTDAGANDLLRVAAGREAGDDESGSDGSSGSDESGNRGHGSSSGVSLVAVFPSRTTVPPHPGCASPPAPPPLAGVPTDSVPTAVTVGPDGALYVSELSGVPFCTGNANIYRVPAGMNGGLVTTPWCSGFTTIMDLTWGPDGRLYVLERSKGPVFFATPGDVVRVGPGCTQTPVVTGLNKPGSLVFGKDGKLYVSINSETPAIGQVVRVDP